MLNLSHRLSSFQIPPCFLHVAGLLFSQAFAKSQSTMLITALMAL